MDKSIYFALVLLYIICNMKKEDRIMGRFIDLTNQKFTRLTVIEKLRKEGNEWVWKCKCSCGNICEVKGVNLRRGKTQSCGCLKKESDKKPKGNVIEMINKKFGHLTVVLRDGSDDRGEAKWLCQCDCGNSKLISVLGSNLRTGHTQSCGCDRRSHGELAIEYLLNKYKIPYECEKIFFKFANNTNAKFDFYVNNQYLIEFDGEQHFNQSNLHGWFSHDTFTQQQERDIIKNKWCEENNIPLIRIPYTHLKDLCIEDLLLETSPFIIDN